MKRPNIIQLSTVVNAVDRPEQSMRSTTIWLCYLGFLLSFADRTVFSLVIKPIKASFHFSDSQVGFLAGAAFALVFAVCSPISGYIVDRFNRKWILLLAVSFWSLMTMMTGLATSFSTMAFSRALVGVGEAVMHPLAVSLISDSVPQTKRARIFGFYFSASAMGSLLSSLLGGSVVHTLSESTSVHVPFLGPEAPWRVVFLVMGVPGFLLAAAVLLLMKEPARSKASLQAARDTETPFSFAKRYWVLLAAMLLGLAFCQVCFVVWGAWNVVFFGRVYGWTISQTAFRVVAPGSMFAVVGSITSGRIMERLRSRGYVDAPLRVGVFASVVLAVMGSAALLIHNSLMATILLVIASFWGPVPSVALYATIGDVIPAASRGRFTGFNVMALGLITTSGGPYLVGALSDTVFTSQTGIAKALAVTFLLSASLATLFVLPGLSGYRRRMTEMPAPGVGGAH